MMIEHQLLRLILNKEAYVSLKPYIYENILTSELRGIYRTIVSAHDKYDHDLELQEVELLHYTSNTFSEAKKNVLGIVFEKIQEVEQLHGDVVRDIAIKLSKQKIAQEAMELLSPVVLGKQDDLSTIVNLLQTYKFEDKLHDIEQITTDISDLVPLSMPERRYDFALQPLQEKVLGAGPGNFVIVFGRPEIGKSTFVADNNVGYLKQGLKVAYFGNEEPGWKIMMNHIRSATGLTDKELQDNFKAGVKEYEEWNAVKENFFLYDGVGLSVSDLNNYIQSSNADIVIVDQLDKVSVPTKHNQEHSRLKQVYVQARELAKRNNVLVIGVSQASAEAEGRRKVHFSMMDESKTGKAGEADVIIGIGKSDIDGPIVRTLFLSKNKISGEHGAISCMFHTEVCKVLP